MCELQNGWLVSSLKYLVKKCNADVNVNEKYGQTPLHISIVISIYAIAGGSNEIVTFL